MDTAVKNIEKNIDKTLLKISMVVIILFYIFGSTANAYTQDELEWKDIISGTLKYNEYIIAVRGGDEYKVKVVDFPSPVRGIRNTKGEIVPETPVVPSVMLELTKTTRNFSYVMDRFALEKNDFKITNDEIKVIVTDLPGPNSTDWIYESYKPWVTLTIQLVKMPEFDITIDMPKTTFGYDDDSVEIGITINNTGSNAKNIDVIINTEGLKLIKGLNRESYSFLKSNESIITDISIEIPKILYGGQRTYNISVTASGYDIRGVQASDSENKKIIVGSNIGPLEVVKFTKSIKDRSYIGDNVLISLNIQNNGKFSIDSIIAEDPINNTDNDNSNNHFKLLENITQKWYSTSAVSNGGTWTVEYLVKPLEHGKYTLPAARANISIYGIVYDIKSNAPTIDIYGPKIVLTKSANIVDNKLTVNLKVRNDGNIPTDVGIKDKLPDGAVIISGKTEGDMYLDVSTEKYLSYEAKLGKTDNVTISPAIAYFTIGGYKDSVLSNVPMLAIYNETNKQEIKVPPQESDTNDTNKTEFDMNEFQKELKKPEQSVADKILSKIPKFGLENIIAIVMLIAGSITFYIFFIKKRWNKK